MGRSHGMDWTAPGRMERLRSLRADGFQYHQIAVVLGSEWGVTLTSSQCNAAYNSAKKAESISPGQVPEPDKQETKPTVEVTAPVVHTSRSRAESYLIIPDLQMPFHAVGALEFCERVRREFAIPKENVLFCGDEVDNFHGKGLDKKGDPDAAHTPRQELAAAVDELKRWYATYPTARLAVSNHGTRYERRAAEAEISSQWMRLYRDVIEAPPGWQWQDSWLIRASKHPFMLEHGHEGKAATEAKVLENGYSTVHGHFTKAQYIRVTNRHGRKLWGFCAAALIDFDTYAFKYAKKYPRRPDNGCGVILDGGRIPIHIPFED